MYFWICLIRGYRACAHFSHSFAWGFNPADFLRIRLYHRLVGQYVDTTVSGPTGPSDFSAMYFSEDRAPVGPPFILVFPFLE